jgi:8-oxo-dGTP pyrophosphatase MutT (NUDIX family)
VAFNQKTRKLKRDFSREMKRLSLPQIRAVLADYGTTKSIEEPARLRAAVSIILKPVSNDVEVLFILRASQVGDPWSGQIAFPGGHYEDQDHSMKETAERETREEIGISLPEIASYLGPIAPVSATPKKTGKELTVYPFVYWLNEKDPVTSPNYEVAQIIWGSLNGMYSGKSNTHYRFKVEEKYETFPGYDIGEQTVWGLTYRMIHILFQTIDSSWHFHS